MDENTLKFILKVFIIVLLIFALIVFINTIGLNLNTEEKPKKLIKVVTLEGLETIPETDVNFNKNHVEILHDVIVYLHHVVYLQVKINV